MQDGWIKLFNKEHPHEEVCMVLLSPEGQAAYSSGEKIETEHITCMLDSRRIKLADFT